jgi:hypothetical protein
VAIRALGGDEVRLGGKMKHAPGDPARVWCDTIF